MQSFTIKPIAMQGESQSQYVYVYVMIFAMTPVKIVSLKEMNE